MKSRHSLPAEVYALVDQTPAAVLLEGGSPRKSIAAEPLPWTRLFLAPTQVCVVHRLAGIPALFRVLESAVASGLCAAGFFSYECGQAFEPKAQMRQWPEHAPEHPLAWIGIYPSAYIFDHATGQFLHGDPPGLVQLRAHSAGREAPIAETVIEETPLEGLPIAASFPLSEADYACRIAHIHQWIRSGDVYQLNFTAPLRTQVETSAAALYARLRERQPVDYGAFVHWQPGRRILSFSPELFFRIDGQGSARSIHTRPMKGTAPRGRTTREDREQSEWLRADPKNRSENLMIVDLLRNDLGRLARFGTVHVDNLFAVERHPTLWQMTSSISAELRSNVGFEEVFRALFPSGSVTGAPKVRAMQLIAAIEDAPRGVYTGAIGFFSPEQSVFNVAIRTIELEDAPENACANSPSRSLTLRGSMGLGSGIVIDSEPAAEYRECLLKAEFLARAPVEFSLVETILWNRGFPLLELHLERLADSADYFDYSFDSDSIRAALHACARLWVDPTPRKVRLLLNRDGAFALTAEGLPPVPDPSPPARVSLSGTRTDPADPFLFHKTTHRPLYAQEFAAATRAGFDDVLFFNLRGELTEGAISNVFLEKNGRWFTPHVECGLLAGVYRRHLLESGASAAHPAIEERILTEDDLRSADAVYLSNALRGLRRATIDWQSSTDL
jgi:para-aminobenzoate synthetase / 4-amino-4-deoxychorismate lyase